MDFRNYDPEEVALTFADVNIRGYMDGTFIEVERDEDAFMKHVGTLGDVTRTRNLNKSGKVTVTLTQASPTNDFLDALRRADEQFGLSYGPLFIRDFNGNMEVRVTYAWISKPPKVERAKEAGSVQWVFECADLDIRAGGNVI